MKHETISALIKDITSTLGITKKQLEQRKKYLNISQKDLASLNFLQSTVNNTHEQIMDDFYSHLMKFPETRQFLKDPQTLERLKIQQTNYLSRLLDGQYDWDYLIDRLTVGIVHQHIGLEPQWYIGAYCHYVCDIINKLSENPDASKKNIYTSLTSLIKIVFLDIGLVLDTYFSAAHKQILSLKNHAENIVCSVPAALIVLDNDLQVVSANRSIEEFTLISHDKIRGWHVDKVLPNLGLTNRTKEVLSNGIPQQGIIFDRTTSDGEQHHYEISIAPMWNQEANEIPSIHGSLLILIEDLTEQEHLRLSTSEADSRIRAIMDNVADGIISIDEQGLIESFNLSAEKIFGYSTNEVIGLNIKHLMPSPYHDHHDEYLDAYKQSRKKNCLNMGFREVEGKRKDGSIFPMDLSISEVPLDGNKIYVGIIRDTTAQRADQEKMAKLSKAMEQTADSIMITDQHGIIEYVNSGFEKTTGYTRSESVGLTPALLKSGLQDKTFYTGLWKTILAGNTFRDIFINRKKNGELYHEEKTISPLRDSKGNVSHFVSSGKDITTRMRSAERYEYLAHHDALTGLYNRLLFMDRLSQAANQSPRTKRKFAVLYADLDRFKNINDTLGHEAGDELLLMFANRLKKTTRESDTVARLSGDEFAIIANNISSISDTTLVAHNLLRCLTEPFIIENRELFISTSVGIAIYPDNGTEPKVLLKNADIAMYKAKSSGGNNYQYYNPEMNALADKQLTLENELRRALEKNQLHLEYQPKVSHTNHKIEGVEALLRWNRTESSIIYPTEFVHLLEETGLIIPIGEWILLTACQQLKKWQNEKSSIKHVSVNISPRQLLDPDFPQLVKDILHASQLDPESLELEITENSLINNEKNAIKVLKNLSQLGIRLAIDDFGTGFASLRYLQIFPVNTLKIDRTFVKNLPNDEDSCNLTAAIINMGHSLNLTVVAEGVETEDQHAFLEKHGCDSYQGYYFSEPLLPDDIKIKDKH